jgi:hypothetical protein
LQTNNGNRGLLPSPWALDYNNDLLFSLGISEFKKKSFFLSKIFLFFG